MVAMHDGLLLPWRPDLDVVLVLWQLHTGDPLENLCVGAVVPSESCAVTRTVPLLAAPRMADRTASAKPRGLSIMC